MAEWSIYEGLVLEDEVRIERLRNKGQFGFVFRAEDIRSRDTVAVKILKAGMANPITRAEFRNEGEILEKLSGSSHVVELRRPVGNEGRVTVYSKTPSGGEAEFELEFPYLVLEWMDVSMAEMLVRRDSLEWHERFSLIRQVALGVHQMHLKDVYHRDLKCDNVLVGVARGADYIAKVSDFGRSRNFRVAPLVPEDHYAFGRGHMLHAPPECLWGLGASGDAAAFRRFDLYLLGSVLFELTVGSSITSVVYPRPDQIGDMIARAASMSADDRRDQYAAAANMVRAHFAPAFTMFEDALPANVREQAGGLMRQLCDPRPERREYRGYRRRKEYQPGLPWLLRKLEILARMSGAPSSAARSIRGGQSGRAS
ncbi:MAG: protein kinase [Acidimicrobiales bacterium]|jgi:serine/threonine protein kinase